MMSTEETTVTSQTELKTVFLAPYILLVDEVQPIQLMVYDRMLEGEFGWYVVESFASIFI